MSLIKKVSVTICFFGLLYSFYLAISFEHSVILGLALILSNQE